MDKITGLLFLFLSSALLQACSTLSQEQRIIDKAIEAHGGEWYKQVEIGFDFREIHYQILKTADRFDYSREFVDSSGVVMDVLTDEGFARSINGEMVEVTDERKQAYTNSLNSVAYFAFLPYGLNDPAAQKEWLGETQLEGKEYDLIRVTFTEEEGGEDFEDVFLYWINQDSGYMDFLAYTYHTEGGGVRFRKSVNPRTINGIRVQDYENYMPEDKDTPLEEMQHLFAGGQLELLSEISIKNVTVKKIN